jgi:putative ABC transport system permease protein
MPFYEALRLALQSIWSAKLRSFFTFLGIQVSVGFLVVVVAVIQGMNSYVKENLTGAVVGTNAFQVRRTPIAVGLADDSTLRAIAKRPLISAADAEAVRLAIPDAQAVSLQSGWPTPTGDVSYRNRTVGSVLIFGVTPGYQSVQDYRIAYGSPLTDPDVTERRHIAVVGYEVASKLFDDPQFAIGKHVRIGGRDVAIQGVIAKKGRLLGQSFDGFVLLPLSTFESFYGRRKTTTVSVKMNDAGQIDGAMLRAEEAMRLAHRLRPGDANDFTVDKADALVAFWRQLTAVLFTAIPGVVCIGIVVGGIVIMNIMLMAVTERTREIGIRRALGARQSDILAQFVVESATLSGVGAVIGVGLGIGLAFVVRATTPLPAAIAPWSIGVGVVLGVAVGIGAGVYPARQAAKLDPITALRAD